MSTLIIETTIDNDDSKKLLLEQQKNLTKILNHSYPTSSHNNLYVILVNGVQAGCITLTRLTDRNYEIGQLYITPDYQGLNLGYKLCQYVILEAQKKGALSIYLETFKELDGQNAIYTSLGFTKVSAYNKRNARNAIYMNYTFVKDDKEVNLIIKTLFKLLTRSRYH